MQKNHLWCFVLFASACSEYDLKLQQDPNRPGEGDTAAGFDTANPFDTSGSDGPIVDSGNSSPSGEKPVAVCEVSPNPVKPPAESAAWDGSGSYDPSGSGIDSYRWVLSSAPSGSSVSMPGGSSAVRGGFTPDLAGNYVGQLVVTNNGVSSDPCEVTLESIPSEDLWVEMYWTESGDDMDLHLSPPAVRSKATKTATLPTACLRMGWWTRLVSPAMHRMTPASISTTFQVLDPKTSILKHPRMETSPSSCTTILAACTRAPIKSPSISTSMAHSCGPIRAVSAAKTPTTNTLKSTGRRVQSPVSELSRCGPRQWSVRSKPGSRQPVQTTMN